MSAIGDYFSWAADASRSGAIAALLVFVVIPALALATAGVVLAWVAVAGKFLGHHFATGFRRGWSR